MQVAPEQKLIKNYGEKGAWAYPGTAQSFWLPPIISGTCKATTIKFVHQKLRRKVSMGVFMDCPNFLGTPLLSQEQVKL